MIEVIDAQELARRWSLPVSWIRNHSQNTVMDAIPSVKLGKYRRYEWGSPELAAWWEKQKQK